MAVADCHRKVGRGRSWKRLHNPLSPGFFIFVSIGYDVPIDKVIITNTIAANIQTQGVALAGLAQLISLNIYNILLIPSSISGASTLLAGFASFWFKTILAFFAFQTVVFSRCVPPFCMRVGSPRGKSHKSEKMLAQSSGDMWARGLRQTYWRTLR